MTTNDILNRLNAGENLDDIAAELSKMLTDAKNQYNTQKYYEDDAADLADHINSFCDTHYPKLADLGIELTATDIKELFTMINESIDYCKELFPDLFSKNK